MNIIYSVVKIRLLIHLVLLINCVDIIETAEPCSTANQLPVVNICAKDIKVQDASKTVLVKADSSQNCTCELSIVNQDQAVTVHIEKFRQEISSSPAQFNCGLILHFGEDVFWIANCVVDNTTIPRSINHGKVMKIRSWKVNGNLKTNEGYCMEIRNTMNDTGTRNILKLACGIDDLNTANTIQATETTPEMTPIIHPQLTTSTTRTTTKTNPEITTTATTTTTTPIYNTEFTIVDGYVSTKQANQLEIKGNDDTTSLAAGASVGGFVTIIVVIVIVCIYRRNHPKSTSKPGLAENTDNDDYGLRDNVLYVSSEPSDTTQTPNDTESPTRNQISFEIDVNYSTVDLDEIPSVEESTGDYTSIDLEKSKPSKANLNGSTNEKPIIAPKPKQKMTNPDDIYSVPDKKRVKHVTAPGENGCEYAVVNKPNISTSGKSEDQPSTSNMSNVYAVVEQKKRMSSGKGTNQKRDSLKAEND